MRAGTPLQNELRELWALLNLLLPEVLGLLDVQWLCMTCEIMCVASLWCGCIIETHEWNCRPPSRTLMFWVAPQV